MNKAYLSVLAIFILPTLLAACGKENKADVGCPDISGEWTGDGLVGVGPISITQSGCDSITGPLVTDDAQTISTNPREIDGKTVRAEFSKDGIVIVREQKVTSSLGTDDQVGKTSIMRATITKVSNEELNIVINVDGPDLFRTLFDQRPDKTMVLRRAKTGDVPRAPEETPVEYDPEKIEDVKKAADIFFKAMKNGGLQNIEQSMGELDATLRKLNPSSTKPESVPPGSEK